MARVFDESASLPRMSPRCATAPDLQLSATQTPAWLPGATLLYALRLDEATPSNNEIKSMHFHTYKKEREHWRRRVGESVGEVNSIAPAPKFAGLVIVRHSSGSLDWDNAYGGLKPLLDCLVLPTDRNPSGLGLITDDAPRFMPHPPLVLQAKAAPKKGMTDLYIFAINE